MSSLANTGVALHFAGRTAAFPNFGEPAPNGSPSQLITWRKQCAALHGRYAWGTPISKQPTGRRSAVASGGNFEPRGLPQREA